MKLNSLHKNLLILSILFIVARIFTSYIYKDVYYYYGMISNQFSIAEAYYEGHDFSYEKKGMDNPSKTASDEKRFVPIEEWKNYKGTGVYETFPAQDLPGFGYLIAYTSKMFSDELTSKYAYIIQVLLELLTFLLFVFIVSKYFSLRVGFVTGLLYIFAYPFHWPTASLPMRDTFIVGVFGSYLMSFYVFDRYGIKKAWALIAALTLIGTLCLWVRPSGYYFYLFAAPLVFFLKNKTIKEKAGFWAVTILIPYFLFSYQFKQFNLKYYGAENTDFVGRALWQGMGIVKDNPYGFVLDDAALVPWTKEQGYDYEYSSPEMNKLLGDYAKKIIKEDPLFYLKTVYVRTKEFIKFPVYLLNPNYEKTKLYTTYKGPKYGFIIDHPILFIIGLYNFIFHLWVLIAVYVVYKGRDKILQYALLLSPFFYIVATQLPLHFEQRYVATGAWVMVMPFAVFLIDMYEKGKLFVNKRKLQK